VFDAQDPAGVHGPRAVAARCARSRHSTARSTRLDAWITGLRREQAATRADARKLEFDARRGVWKANPLADWTDHAVWDYIARHNVPYNSLHDRGYASIGCSPCTLPGSGREGRWADSDKVECGLHLTPE